LTQLPQLHYTVIAKDAVGVNKVWAMYLTFKHRTDPEAKIRWRDDPSSKRICVNFYPPFHRPGCGFHTH